VLGNADGLSSLATSLSMVAELLEGRTDTVSTNGVCWGTQSTLVAALLHFLELKFELELHGFGRNADLTDDQLNALWPVVSVTSDSPESLVPSSIVCNPPDDVVE
jgi:hypothetical protein